MLHEHVYVYIRIFIMWVYNNMSIQRIKIRRIALGYMLYSFFFFFLVCFLFSSSAANHGDNTVSVAQGGTATTGATK